MLGCVVLCIRFAAHSDDRDGATRSARVREIHAMNKVEEQKQQQRQTFVQTGGDKVRSACCHFTLRLFCVDFRCNLPHRGSSNGRLSKRLRSCALFQGVSDPFHSPTCAIVFKSLVITGGGAPHLF